MIEIFRTNQFFATLLLLPYTFLIRIHSLIHPERYEVQAHDTPFSKYLFTNVLESAIFQNILACFIVFLAANFVNRHIIQNRISKYQTLLPGLFFILLTAGIPGGMICSPVLLSCFFILLALLNINGIYKTHEFAIKIFNTGLHLAFALLLYSGNVSLWGLAVISILILRSFRLNEILILTSGMFVPIFLAGVYYYWHGELDLIWEYFQFGNGILSLFWRLSLESILYLAAIGLVVIFVIARYNNYTMKNAIQVQKKIDIIYWFMFFSLVITFFVNGLSATHLLILAIPFSMFIGLSYEKMKSSMLAEVLHIVMIILILTTHFA